MESHVVENHAANALKRFMEWWSEEYWCAGWLCDLEFYMSKPDAADAETFEWLVDQAGGWWTWAEGDGDVVFVSGTIKDLRKERI